MLTEADKRLKEKNLEFAKKHLERHQLLWVPHKRLVDDWNFVHDQLNLKAMEKEIEDKKLDFDRAMKGI